MQYVDTFKMNPRHLILCTSTLAILLLTIVIVYEDGLDINLIAYGMAVGFVIVFCIISSFIMSAYYKVTLNDNGLEGFNFWGISLFIEWGNITNVKPINFFGLPFLRVLPNNSRLALWVPLFMKDVNGFHEQSSYIPPEGNVFREYFSK